MNKNTVTGFVLIAVVLIVFSWLSRPSEEQVRAQQAYNDSIARVYQEAQEKQAAQEAVEQTPDSTLTFFNAIAKANSLKGGNDSIANDPIVLKNEKVALTFDAVGGTIKEARLLDQKYKSIDSANVLTLFAGTDQRMNFMLSGKQENIETQDLYFDVEEQSDNTLKLSAKGANGAEIIFEYELGEDYMLHFSMQTKKMGGMFKPGEQPFDILWTDSCRQQERGYDFESRYATLTYKKQGGGTSTADKLETMEKALDWVAFKNQFFSVVLIPENGFSANATLAAQQLPKVEESNPHKYLKYYYAMMPTTFDPSGQKPARFEMYIGPNDFQLLKQVEKQSRFGKELDLEQLVYLGWPLFRIINRWFTLYVFDGLTSMGINMGIVIILITLLLKFITFPMVKKSFLSSAKMRVLRPKIEEATKQYDKPEDKMLKQQAQMQIYSKYGVSPLGGCLPMLIQMPIWIAMFNFVPNAIQLRGESFLWIDDLSTYDPIITFGTNIPLVGDHLSLTCLLFCISNVLYSYMTMRQQRDQMIGDQAQQMKMMQWMMYLMPLMFFFMFNTYSSGLNFYYFISLFFSAAIMWTLRKTTNEEKLLAQLEANYRENQSKPKKQGGLAARLEAMQKQAAEMQKQRDRYNRR